MLNDLARFVRINPAFQSPDLADYFHYPDWDPEWELRLMPFAHVSGQHVAREWSGWQRVQ
jgi:hypothetical protein